MACNSCGSVNQGKFASEIEIYFPGLRNVNKRPVMYTLSLAFRYKKSVRSTQRTEYCQRSKSRAIWRNNSQPKSCCDFA